MRSELHFLTLFNNLIFTQEVTSWETTAQKDSDFWPPKSIIWQKSEAGFLQGSGKPVVL